MKVKIGNNIYDSMEEPIMIILTNDSKEHIVNMSEKNMKYCEYPCDKGFSIEEMERFMEVVN